MKKKSFPPRNWNDLAKEISIVEGKKKEVNIAQIKEVMKCFWVVFAKYPLEVSHLFNVKIKKISAKQCRAVR